MIYLILSRSRRLVENSNADLKIELCYLSSFGQTDSWTSLETCSNLFTLRPPLVLTFGGYWSMNGMLKRAVRIPLECFFVIQVFVKNDMRPSPFILIHLLESFSILSRKL